ncbi:nuclear transport factor 2 family protein [Mycobacterium sp. 3519A]|uniref:nuclear transport factor 2 family protein n=1 Tax=Mycobacterium sp. 3519A TaxID=2057184 RepID=UPI000C7B4173|nr:nuclear transport factor 2 family protein [Mycobacterium sp. 3519A]
MNENTSMVETTSDATLAVWLEMWNADSAIARRICSADFRIHFLVSDADGSNPFDDVLGAESFARVLDRWREGHPGVVFTEVARAVDGTHGRMLWNMQVSEVAVGGIDVFDFTEEGLIREVWSVNGTRTHLT